MPRDAKPSGGRSFSKTCLVRGREFEGRKAVIKTGSKRVRVAPIGPDGLTLDGAEVVATADVLDVQAVKAATHEPVTALVGERGTLTIPRALRSEFHLRAGTPVLIEKTSMGILIRRAEVRPATGETLDALLDRVTPENSHHEVDTGPAVGAEAW